MVKSIIVIVTVGLLSYVGYYQVAKKPLDSRASIEAGIEQVKASSQIGPAEEELLRVQLALADYSATNGAPPDFLEELVPKYFDSVPKDPTTNKAYEYQRDNLAYRLGAQVHEQAPVQLASAKSAAKLPSKDGDVPFINPNTLQLEFFTYDPEGKRDPFEPFNFAPAEQVDMSLPPLERYALGQLKITAILADSKAAGERIAIVEDATGRGYTVRKGTKIGNRNGIVVSIEEDKINVVESIIDFTGKETKVPVVMRVPPRKEHAGVFNRGNK